MNPIDKLSPGAKATFEHMREIMAVFGDSAQAATSAVGGASGVASTPVPTDANPKTAIVFTAKVVVDYARIPLAKTYDYGREIDRLRELVFQKADSLAEQFDVEVEDGYGGGWRFNLEVIFQAKQRAEIAGAISAFEAWIADMEELKLSTSAPEEG